MAERGNGSTAEAAKAEASPAAARPSEGDSLDFKARLERFGEILARGLDLAEAGMNLGLTILGTIGHAAQTKIIERMLTPGGEEAPASGPAPPVTATPPQPEAATATYGITNRLPLRPGGAVSISFSVNNESAVQPKTVRLIVEEFSGERSGAMLAAGSFSVSPEEKAIAPMDFEKFVLEGMIPADAVADFYRGSVVVIGEGPMRIPVALLVEAGP